MTEIEKAKDRIARFIREDCFDDPIKLNKYILNGPELWSGREMGVDGQVEWCEHLINYRQLVLISGHATGKTFFIALAILWFAITRPNSQVSVYGPCYGAILNGIWRHLRNTIKGEFSSDGRFRKPAIDLKADFKSGGIGNPKIVLGNGSEIIAYSSDKPEKLQGIRRPQTLIVVEEASGCPDFYFDAIRGIGATKILYIGNPLTKSCQLYQLYKQGLEYSGPPHIGIKTCQLSSLQSPDAHLDVSPRGMASKSMIEDFIRNHGVNSPEYRARILGEFPSDDYENLIDLAALDRSMSPATREYAEARRKQDPYSRRILSCDVGLGKGDSRSVIVVRDDYGVLDMVSLQMSIGETAQKMSRVAAEWGVEPHNIVYDANGDTGTRLGKALEAQSIYGVFPFFGGDTSDRWGKGYAQARSAVAYAFSNRLSRQDDPFHLPGDLDSLKLLTEELRALRVINRGDGKSALEDRDALKKRLRRSPDHADALCMSFAPDAKRG
jgi:hypothetical protein